jgi:hypothetical protein
MKRIGVTEHAIRQWLARSADHPLKNTPRNRWRAYWDILHPELPHRVAELGDGRYPTRSGKLVAVVKNSTIVTVLRAEWPKERRQRIFENHKHPRKGSKNERNRRGSGYQH